MFSNVPEVTGVGMPRISALKLVQLARRQKSHFRQKSRSGAFSFWVPLIDGFPPAPGSHGLM